MFHGMHVLSVSDGRAAFVPQLFRDCVPGNSHRGEGQTEAERGEGRERDLTEGPTEHERTRTREGLSPLLSVRCYSFANSKSSSVSTGPLTELPDGPDDRKNKRTAERPRRRKLGPLNKLVESNSISARGHLPNCRRDQTNKKKRKG